MSSPTLLDEDRSRLNRMAPAANRTLGFQNIPIKFGKTTIAAQTTNVPVTGALTTDVVTFGIEAKDSGALTVVEYAKISAAGNLQIKTTAAPVGNDGIVSWVIHRPTDPA